MTSVRLCLAILLAGAAWFPSGAQDLFLSGGTLVDPVGSESTRANLLILDGRIAGRPAEPPTDFQGDVLDVAGKWVIPALHDLHVHSFGNQGPSGQLQILGTPRTAELMLYAGVAGFLDLFSPEDLIFGLRDRQRQGNGVPGADIFAAGPCLTATAGHCSEYGLPTRIIDTPEDALREISDLATKHPDVVKIVFQRGSRRPTIDVPTLQAALRAAHDLGLKTVIHVGRWEDAHEAILGGASALTHTPEDSVVTDELVALMAERGTVLIPTLAVHGDIAWWFDDPTRLDNPLVQAVTTEFLRQGFTGSPPEGGISQWVESARELEANRFASVKKLHRAGVAILTGTDAGNPGVFLGYSVHRELALLVDAGLSPLEALAASTSAAGKFLGRRWGLSNGDEGSVLVLRASPLEDIRNSEAIETVIQRGMVVDRAALLNAP